MKIALLQTNIHFLEPEKNYKNVERLIEKAIKVENKPDVLLLPEDWATGFSDKMFHEIEKHVECFNGPSLTFLKDELSNQMQHLW